MTEFIMTYRVEYCWSIYLWVVINFWEKRWFPT